MIRDARALEEFERELFREHRLTHRQALALLDGLWAEGRTLGVLPPADPLVGIEVDIRVAAILNSCPKETPGLLLSQTADLREEKQ